MPASTSDSISEPPSPTLPDAFRYRRAAAAQPPPPHPTPLARPKSTSALRPHSSTSVAPSAPSPSVKETTYPAAPVVGGGTKHSDLWAFRFLLWARASCPSASRRLPSWWSMRHPTSRPRHRSPIPRVRGAAHSSTSIRSTASISASPTPPFVARRSRRARWSNLMAAAMDQSWRSCLRTPPASLTTRRLWTSSRCRVSARRCAGVRHVGCPCRHSTHADVKLNLMIYCAVLPLSSARKVMRERGAGRFLHDRDVDVKTKNRGINDIYRYN
jgi:hypothetical protein